MSEKKECMGCGGTGWMTLQPQNLVAPCLMCSATRSLRDIEAERGMKLEKHPETRQWREVPLQSFVSG